MIADSNFPAASVAAANGAKLIRMSGVDACTLLDAIATLFPLDEYDKQGAAQVMQVVPGS